MALKPEEQAELLKFVGLEAEESLEAAKEKFNENYMSVDSHRKQVGKLTGTLAAATRKAFEPFGVSLTDDDFKDKRVEEVFKSAAEIAKQKFEEQKAEWEKRQTPSGSEELLKEWEKKYKAVEKKLSETDQLRLEAVNSVEKIKQEYAEREKSAKLASVFDKAMGNVKLDPQVGEVTLKGFKTVVAEKYIIDLEDDAPVVKYRATGEKIKNTAKAGTFLGIDDVLLKEATELGIIQKNPAAGKATPRVPAIPMAPNQPQPSQPRRVHPRFMGQQ